MEFKFLRFNPRRAMRGADAVEVLAISEDGTEEPLWMSRADIGRNMIAFGRHPELIKAHDAYRATQEPEHGRP